MSAVLSDFEEYLVINLQIFIKIPSSSHAKSKQMHPMRITSRPYNNKPSHLELDPSVKLISKRRSPQAVTL